MTKIDIISGFLGIYLYTDPGVKKRFHVLS